MRKYLCIAAILLMCTRLAGQGDLITQQGFEPTGGQWSPLDFSTPPCSAGGDTWNYVTSLHQILPSQGKWFWGIEDLNGQCGSPDFEWLTLPEVDVTQYQDVQLSFDLWVEGFDNGDDIEYQLILNGEPGDRIPVIEGASDYSTGGWTRISIAVPNKNSSVGIRILVKQNGSDHAGLDNIELRGNPILNCSQVLISEYLEGSSGTSHRNNFIELYNSTSTWVRLDDYSLVKFTGKQTEISASLQLSDSIPPYGTYLIEDDQEILGVEADLSTKSAVMNYNGDDKIGLRFQDRITDLIGIPGDSLYFARDITLRRKSLVQGPNSEFDPAEWDSYGLEALEDLGLHSSICQGPLPEIQVSANQLEIPDGIQSTSKKDNTYFGYLPVGANQMISNDFLIKNLGNAPLTLLDMHLSGPDQDGFVLEPKQTAVLMAGDSMSITVSFSPKRTGLYQTTLHILSSDASESSHDILLQGEGSGPSQSPLMISQYYEGVANNRWIEVTNISGQTVPEGKYYLALFRQDILDHPLDNKPSIKKAIPSLEAGKTILFRATLRVDSPEYALDGSEIPSGVCGFTGDDILVISSSGEEQCWQDRKDIIGRQGNWGTDLSYVRKYGCEAVVPNSGFQPSDWLPYALPEVDGAPEGYNRRLGEHHSGFTVFSDGTWTNGLPDLNKAAEIRGNYLSSQQGDLECCSLLIREKAQVLIEESDYLAVQNDLEVYGSLQIQNGGSLLMINDNGKIYNYGDITLHKKSAPMNRYDYTYWSSPVLSANLDSVFRESPKEYRFFYDTKLFADRDGDGNNDSPEVWQTALGLMEIGKGYAVMAPTAASNGDRQEVSFKGTPNTGAIACPLYLKAEIDGDDDWNLIGNPYPGAIDLERLLYDPLNSDLLGGSCYFWTHNTSVDERGEYTADDYAIYTPGIGGVRASSGGPTPDRFVDSGQGFFVEALKAGELSWKNAMRVIPEVLNFYKTKQDKSKEPKDRLWLNLKAEEGGFNQFLLGFTEKATPDFDKDHDAVRLTANPLFSFYSPLDAKRLAIRGEPSFTPLSRIPLGIEVKKKIKGRLEIALEKAEGDLDSLAVYLLDRNRSVIHDLKKRPYHFNCPEPGVYDRRFELTFERSFFPEDAVKWENPKILWRVQDEMLLVSRSDGGLIENISLYDLLGRKVRSMDSGDREVSVELAGLAANAVYLLHLKTTDGLLLGSKIVPLRP